MVRPDDIDQIDYLSDEVSQFLFLKDALDCGSGNDVSNAFQLAARARGLTGLARDAGMDRKRLTQALRNAEHPDHSILTEVVIALARKWGAPHGIDNDGTRGEDASRNIEKGRRQMTRPTRRDRTKS